MDEEERELRVWQVESLQQQLDALLKQRSDALETLEQIKPWIANTERRLAEVRATLDTP